MHHQIVIGLNTPEVGQVKVTNSINTTKLLKG